MTATQFTREEIESIKSAHDRPKCRIRYECRNIDQDGRKSDIYTRDTTAWISIDGNNPWLVSHFGGDQHAFRLSWSLLLGVLNDPYAAPVCFDCHPVEYQV